MSTVRNSILPVIKVEATTLPEAWEKALLKLWEKGIQIKTEYDKSNDSLSKDCTMIIVVNEPFAEPRIHRAFPGGLEDLEIYRQEVVNGIHDHWIKPEEGKWTYTYHQRLYAYPAENEKINQIDYIIDKLSQVEYSRRAQAITWSPKLDPFVDDSPCLQRIHLRILNNEKGEKFLTLTSHWRSRDAYKASFMNMYALTSLQKIIAERISKKINCTINTGSYIDISDSFHLYGAYFDEFKSFLETLRTRKFSDRVWDTKFAKPFFDEAIRSSKEING